MNVKSKQVKLEVVLFLKGVYEPNFYAFSVLRVASGPRVKLAGCKIA